MMVVGRRPDRRPATANGMVQAKARGHKGVSELRPCDEERQLANRASQRLRQLLEGVQPNWSLCVAPVSRARKVQTVATTDGRARC